MEAAFDKQRDEGRGPGGDAERQPVPLAGNPTQVSGDEESDDASNEDADDDLHEDADDDGGIDEVSALASGGDLVEQDAWETSCRKLSRALRCRPTLPALAEDPQQSFEDVELAIRLPLYSCPFRGCTVGSDHRLKVLKRMAYGPHEQAITQACGSCLRQASTLDCVYQAAALLERDHIPVIGHATTRKALRTLTT